jgi:hypothetical protein
MTFRATTTIDTRPHAVIFGVIAGLLAGSYTIGVAITPVRAVCAAISGIPLATLTTGA